MSSSTSTDQRRNDMVTSRQKTREKDGWERKTTTDEPRLSEFVELYESLGFEVRLEPFQPNGEECSACLVADAGRFKTIFIRFKNRAPSLD